MPRELSGSAKAKTDHTSAPMPAPGSSLHLPLPPPGCRGWTKKLTQDILDFIDTRILQNTRLSLGDLQSEIHENFERQ
jgi:hypothetical protein